MRSLRMLQLMDELLSKDINRIIDPTLNFFLKIIFIIEIQNNSKLNTKNDTLYTIPDELYRNQ